MIPTRQHPQPMWHRRQTFHSIPKSFVMKVASFVELWKSLAGASPEPRVSLESPIRDSRLFLTDDTAICCQSEARSNVVDEASSNITSRFVQRWPKLFGAAF